MGHELLRPPIAAKPPTVSELQSQHDNCTDAREMSVMQGGRKTFPTPKAPSFSFHLKSIPPLPTFCITSLFSHLVFLQSTT